MAGTKREKELARQRAERQAARRAAMTKRRKQRNGVIAGVVALLLLLGTVAAATVATRDSTPTEDILAATPPPSAEPTEEPAPEPSEEPSGEPTEPGADPAGAQCEYPSAGEASRPVEPPPAEGLDTEQPYRATLTTSQGEFVFTTDTAAAPCTVNSFVSLAAQDYFDDTPCHRLTEQGIFVLQCGDPSGTGRGGPGYSFADENLDGATYPRGTVALANSGPDTNGSQFFLVYEDSELPPAYTPFGTLTEESLAVLDTVAEAGASEPDPESGNTAPNLPVQIEEFTLEPVQG